MHTTIPPELFKDASSFLVRTGLQQPEKTKVTLHPPDELFVLPSQTCMRRRTGIVVVVLAFSAVLAASAEAGLSPSRFAVGPRGGRGGISCKRPLRAPVRRACSRGTRYGRLRDVVDVVVETSEFVGYFARGQDRAHTLGNERRNASKACVPKTVQANANKPPGGAGGYAGGMGRGKAVPSTGRLLRLWDRGRSIFALYDYNNGE